MIIFTKDNLRLNWESYLEKRNITLQPGQAMMLISIVQKHTWAQIHRAKQLLQEYNALHIFDHPNGLVAVTTIEIASIVKLAI